MRALRHLTLLVHDYDEALAFYVGCLGFVVTEDTRLSEDKRWVTVRPSAQSEAGLVLGRAVTDEQRAAIGRQGGGRVFLFFETDTLDEELALLRARGVRVLREPTSEPYGRVAVIADLYGNALDLIEPSELRGGT
jgi:predicted enzyme related to lactoylglutathione lyase